MRQGKEISSVKNSIQTRLSGVMLLVLVFALGINVFIFKQIHTAVTRIDAVFSSNTAVNELSESLEQVESTVYEYLNTKSTQALENYYRYEQNYKNLIEELNDRNLDNEVKMLEKNIRRMSESYLEQTNETVQAKRGRNVEKYKTSYEDENELYEYINVYIYKLNNLRFKTNSANYQLLLSAMNVLYKLCIFVMLVVYALGLAVTTLLVRNMIRPLTALSNTAHEVAKGNLNVPQLPVVVEDEVGVVTRSFNQMLESIRQNIEQLKESMEDAHRANLSKTAFLRRMSHDIRTPLNGIVGMIHIAEKYNNDVVKLRECRKKVLQSADYLQNLINNVLDISKLESGSLVLEHKSFDLAELLRNNLTVVAMSAYENGVRFEGGVEASTIRHRYLIGSPVHLSRVLMNLSSNAIKYNHFHGTVNVHCEELSDDGNIAVFQFVCSDTGLGMSEEFQKHAFDAFAQEGKQSTTTFSGSGLGLSIVKDIVERMGGTIELESEENVGSTFTVTVPFEIDYLVENNDSQKDSYSQDMDLSGKRVLLVEDNVINMEIAHAILEEEHLNITEAKNGKEAFEIFQNSRLDEYDVIIMDVMMPVMDGLEATKAIRMLEREDAKKIPIIAMTANAFEEDRKACLEAGMNEHIGKPIDIPRLKRAITKLLTKKG